MKPDWKDAPEWARYLTRDCDGSLTWHETEPYFSEAAQSYLCRKGRALMVYVEPTIEARPE